MGVGAGLYMYDVVVKKFTFAISSPDEFLFSRAIDCAGYSSAFERTFCNVVFVVSFFNVQYYDFITSTGVFRFPRLTTSSRFLYCILYLSG